VAWATKALDALRRGLAAQLRRTGHPDQATTIKHTRWALLKNPPELTGEQRTTLAAIDKDNGALYWVYLLTEQLRMIFEQLPGVTSIVTHSNVRARSKIRDATGRHRVDRSVDAVVEELNPGRPDQDALPMAATELRPQGTSRRPLRALRPRDVIEWFHQLDEAS
jgi:hypothetical protein